MTTELFQSLAKEFPEATNFIEQFQTKQNAKLWHELTVLILQFLYHPSVKGRVKFEFYEKFIKTFEKSINQIQLLKIIKQLIFSLTNEQIIVFLNDYIGGNSFQGEIKFILKALLAEAYVETDFSQCSALFKEIQQFINSKKELDAFVYTTFYRFAIKFHRKKNKQKDFYNAGLQYLAYTPLNEMQPKYKNTLLIDMALAVLVSDEIYNFSELLQQPLLKELGTTQHSWLYQLLKIFDRGDISGFSKIALKHELLKKYQSVLEKKIKLMAFIDLTFNLPKSNRVIHFSQIAQTCSIKIDEVQFMVMRAMALKLVKGSINQLTSQVTISWVAPKVLQTERIGVMLNKFSQWHEGIQNVQELISGASAQYKA